MENDQELKHMCKFCYKSFPCGRSLGGHMRSHLINIPFDHNQKKTDKKLPKKKLPPLINPNKFGNFIEDGGRFGCEKPKKTSKLCKECDKSFQSWKALFGHMKCHSVNGKAANSLDEEDFWDSSSYDQKLSMRNQSDDESETSLCRKKRSERTKRYYTSTNSSSFNMIPSFSPCVFEIDQQEEEEVAMSLILLSTDNFGNLRGADSVFESADNSSEFLQAKKNSKSLNKNSKTKLEKIEQFKSRAKESEFRNPGNPRTRLEIEFLNKNTEIEGNESEVNSPKSLIKRRGLDQFETGLKKEKPNKRKLIYSHDSATFSVYKSPSDLDFERTSKFTCTVCKRAFPSYQALGGHRASHKKFNGCCAPFSENSHENRNSPNQSTMFIEKCTSNDNLIGVFEAKSIAKLRLKKNKEHDCPICFKVFQSGQALGGHKRSHVIADRVKINNPDVIQKPKVPEIRDFLDLNLPAPDEEDEEGCNEFEPWLIGARPEHDQLLGSFIPIS